MENILLEWERFCRTCLPASQSMESVSLRDHAKDILEAIASDLSLPQSDDQALAKSKGKGPEGGELDVAGSEHAAGRVAWGFSLRQLAAEYRALRASVVRLWLQSGGDAEALMRFHESVDQVLAASLLRYDLEFSRARDMFLAILGHDLRAPLNSLMMGSAYLLRKKDASKGEITDVLEGMAASGQRMKNLIQNLIEFAKLRVGEVMELAYGRVDLRHTVKTILKEMSPVTDPNRFVLQEEGDLTGEWDEARLEQVFSNLIGNALTHGSPTEPITITIAGESREVVLSVNNFGEPISEAQRKEVFLPFKTTRKEKSSVGLGLYISSEIVQAHGGIISVSSSKELGTSFTVRLPREKPAGHTPPERIA